VVDRTYIGKANQYAQLCLTQWHNEQTCVHGFVFNDFGIFKKTVDMLRHLIP